MIADAVHVFGVRRLDDRGRRRLTRALCIALPLLCWFIVLAVGKPVGLVIVGGVAQAAMLPFLAIAVCYLRYRKTRPELAPRSMIDPFLWLAVLSTGGICFHQLIQALARP